MYEIINGRTVTWSKESNYLHWNQIDSDFGFQTSSTVNSNYNKMFNQSVDLELQKNETNNAGNDNRLISTGPDSPYFKLIHITAVVMCVVSVTASTCTLVYLRRKEKETFYQWKIGR